MNNGHKTSLLYRLITKQEWDRLTPIFQGMNKFMPPAELAVASIAEADGEIAAMVALQMVSYMGPLYINPKYTNLVDYKSLKAPIDAVYSKSTTKPLIVQGYLVLTSDERIARIAEMAGLVRKPEAILLIQEFGK